LTCDEARELLGAGLTTVAVKQGLGRFSARQIPPLRAPLTHATGQVQDVTDADRAVALHPPPTTTST